MIRLKYFDSVRHLLRSGKSDDPYIIKITQEKIVNNKLNLDEIPDPMYHVRINEYTEIDRYKYYENKEILSNQFYVEYDNGVVYFNPSEEGKTVSIEYKGRGVLQFPAERIWVHSPNPWAIDNLQELIDYIGKIEKDLKDKFLEFTLLVNQKTQEILKKVDDFTQFLLEKTNEYEHYIDGWINKANDKIEEVDKTLDIARDVIHIGQETTEKCEKATNECIETTINSRVIWQPSIPSYLEINERYPFPEIGWTTICDDNGDIIRFNGSAWIKIGNIVGTVPLSTTLRDGLMSKEDKFKLNTVKQGAEPNLKGNDLKEEIPIELKIKSIIFTIPNEVRTGDVGFLLQAPFEGIITRVTGYAQNSSVAGEWGEFSILKSPINKLNTDDGWQEITDKYNRIRFLGNSRVAEPPNLNTNKIGRYDVFRVICTRQAEGLSNVTIQIDYKI